MTRYPYFMFDPWASTAIPLLFDKYNGCDFTMIDVKLALGLPANDRSLSARFRRMKDEKVIIIPEHGKRKSRGGATYHFHPAFVSFMQEKRGARCGHENTPQ